MALFFLYILLVIKSKDCSQAHKYLNNSYRDVNQCLYAEELRDNKARMKTFIPSPRKSNVDAAALVLMKLFH